VNDQEITAAAYGYAAELVHDHDPSALAARFADDTSRVADVLDKIVRVLQKYATPLPPASATTATEPEYGWNPNGTRRPTGVTAIDDFLDQLQDAENCMYRPTKAMALVEVDTSAGPWDAQYDQGTITLTDGTVFERGGALRSVWACTRLPWSRRCGTIGTGR
jgi:hypothetical protein